MVLGCRLAALFSPKVRLMVRGQCNTWRLLRRQTAGNRYVWFHAASLGEFEQGRPLMERLRREHPEKKILLTFFSPSGYEVRKNYEGADIVCYLPLDTPFNALNFVKLARPKNERYSYLAFDSDEATGTVPAERVVRRSSFRPRAEAVKPS